MKITPFTPIKIGSLEIRNRIWLSPMTRSRGIVPTELHELYYEQRALNKDNSGAGLLVTEGLLIEPQGTEYGQVPGIFTEEQILGWKKVVDRVHSANGHIFAQLWHVGRLTHPKLNPNEAQPIGASPITAPGGNFRTLNNATYVQPRELSTEEVKAYIKLYGTAAKNAKRAGFDGVEIHGANGYLVHQFMNKASNQRSDSYGTQNFENRARFALEVIAEAITGFGDESRVAFKSSPGATNGGMVVDEETIPFYKYLYQQIGERFPKLAYLTIAGSFDGGPLDAAFFRDSYKGDGKVLTGSTGYDRAKTIEYLEKGLIDAVHIGRSFIANPDLAYRWANDLPLTEVNWQTLYSSGITDRKSVV